MPLIFILNHINNSFDHEKKFAPGTWNCLITPWFKFQDQKPKPMAEIPNEIFNDPSLKIPPLFYWPLQFPQSFFSVLLEIPCPHFPVWIISGIVIEPGNLTATISDHLPQIMIVPNVFDNPLSNRSNIYERDWSNFDQVNFVLDYFSIDWDDTLKIKEENTDYLTEVFLKCSL